MPHRWTLILSLLSAVAVTGCGDNKNTPATPMDMSPAEPDLPPLPVLDLSNTSPTCQLMVAGATTASVGCTIQGFWTKDDDFGGITLAGSESTPGVSVSINRPGKPAKGEWKESDSGAKAAIVVNSGLDAWSASVDASSATQGSYTLTLTEVTETVTTDGGSGYLVKGTLDATLPPSSGAAATDPVTLHATF
jgi:hypothetical protein